MKIVPIEISNNNPGYRLRYFARQVVEAPAIPVCVFVNGNCNHADTNYEMRGGDGEYLVSVCAKCDAVYNSVLERWES